MRYFKGFTNLKNKARGLSTIIHAIQSPNCRNAYNKNAGVFRTEHTKEPRRLITDKNSIYSYNILLDVACLEKKPCAVRWVFVTVSFLVDFIVNIIPYLLPW